MLCVTGNKGALFRKAYPGDPLKSLYEKIEYKNTITKINQTEYEANRKRHNENNKNETKILRSGLFYFTKNPHKTFDLDSFQQKDDKVYTS